MSGDRALTSVQRAAAALFAELLSGMVAGVYATGGHSQTLSIETVIDDFADRDEALRDAIHEAELFVLTHTDIPIDFHIVNRERLLPWIYQVLDTMERIDQ